MAERERVLKRAVLPDDVLAAVADYFDVDPQRIRSSSTHRHIVQARDFWAYVSRKITNHSFPELQRFLGRHEKSHSTVVAASQRAAQKIADGQTVIMRNGSRPAAQAAKEIEAAARWRTVYSGGAA